MRLAKDREQALDSERRAARRLEAFFEISRSFSESLKLEETIACSPAPLWSCSSTWTLPCSRCPRAGGRPVPRSVSIPGRGLRR